MKWYDTGDSSALFFPQNMSVSSKGAFTLIESEKITEKVKELMKATSTSHSLSVMLPNQRRIQDFPEGGANVKGGPTYCLAKRRWKLHAN